MLSADELFSVVDAAFAVTARGLARWRDPHPDRQPLEEEYSRLTNPDRWRIIGARADAWLQALVETGLANVELGTSVLWKAPPGPILTRTDRVVPIATGAIPLIVARSRLGSVEDAGVTLGAGNPAVAVGWIPDCGCDACDSGSQEVLDELDKYLLSVVSGDFRRLSSSGREITVTGEGRWGASGNFSRDEVDSILDDPAGWDELSGTSWLGDARI